MQFLSALKDGVPLHNSDGYSCVYKYRGQKSKELPQDEWVRLNQLLEEARKNHVGLWGKHYNVMECLCR